MRRWLALFFVTGTAAFLSTGCSESSSDDPGNGTTPDQDASVDSDLPGQDATPLPEAAPEAEPDVTPQPDAGPVDDSLCPDGLSCDDPGSGKLACMENGGLPAGAQMDCETTDCTGNQRCRYIDDTETQTACFENCGICSGSTACMDVTGDGYLGCLTAGSIPSNAPTGCHTTGGCEGNATCFYINEEQTESVCIDNCSPCKEDTCPDGKVCDGIMCVDPPCTEDSCADGEICYDGTCIPDFGDGPGPDTVGDCPNLPPLLCDKTTENCAELIQFDPTVGDGYNDYPENGETASNQYRSWLRRDAVYLIKHAAAYVACKAKDWTFGTGGNVGLIDMSEEDGAIPGTSIGQPGHPSGTHTGGKDIDLAYFQVNTADNRARPVCDHYEGGQEAYHCTAAPHLLDPWRTALFIGALQMHPNLRVIGVDGKVGPIVDMALDTLCADGWLPTTACNVNKLTYEETNQGYGWYLFHHHHFHVSFNGTSSNRSLTTGLQPMAGRAEVLDFYRQQGVSLPLVDALRVPVPAR
jgi:hypothetical protein